MNQGHANVLDFPRAGGDAPQLELRTKSMNPSRHQVDPRENAARALCRFRGVPEDVLFQGKPMWKSYLEEVDVVLSAAATVPAGQLEYIPVRAYHVLRRLSREAITTESMHGFENIGLVQFLVSRGLAVDTDGVLTITPAGKAMGEIEDDRCA